jgi:hypothetical protein
VACGYLQIVNWYTGSCTFELHTCAKAHMCQSAHVPKHCRRLSLLATLQCTIAPPGRVGCAAACHDEACSCCIYCTVGAFAMVAGQRPKLAPWHLTSTLLQVRADKPALCIARTGQHSCTGAVAALQASPPPPGATVGGWDHAGGLSSVPLERVRTLPYIHSTCC